MPYGLKEIELAKLSKEFASNEHIKRVILYGSRAKGNYKLFSDVDITLEGPELTLTDLNHLSLAIDDLLLPYQFDISIFHTLKNHDLIDHIQRIGITIFERESEWKEYKLGEIAVVKGGKRLPKGELLVEYETPHPYIRVTDMTQKWIGKKGLLYVPAQVQKSISRYTVNSGDVILSIVGSIGMVSRVGKDIDGANLTENCVKIIPTNNILDRDYLYYYLNSANGQEEINKRNVGAVQPKLPIYNINDIMISLPSLDTQRRIAAILSSLDDKIDLLHRENATLEQMAETLFRQWFVEDAKEDWEEGKLGDWVVIKRGGSPRPINDYLSPTGYRWLKISDVTNLNSPYIFQTKEYIKESGLSKTVYLKKGSLVLSNSATPGIPKILCVDSCIHDGWLYFPKSTFSKIYLYLLFKYIRKDLVNLGNGSIFTNLKTDILKEYKVVKPDAKTMEVFDQQVQPIFDKLYSNETQIQTLIQTRDGLLPRLMSGGN